MVSYSYLPQQFNDELTGKILDDIREVVRRGDFTLGKEVALFEEEFAQACGAKYAVGVNSGTDALFLPLKALGVTGEVIVPPFSFYATVGAVVQAGATPVFADIGYDFLIDPAAIKAAITPRTEAIIPVHWAGRPCDMDAINSIASKHGLAIIEDAAQAFGAKWNDFPIGNTHHAAAFSLHPLKTLNVWGDGGMITTNWDGVASKLKKWRNHGMKDRDTCEFWGVNSRLDTIQAVVARHVLPNVKSVIEKRRANAEILDGYLGSIQSITLSPVPDECYETRYLYTFRCKKRDRLVSWLIQNNIEAKVHYPVPLHLQPAAGKFTGSFPVAEQLANETVTLPCHEYLSEDDLKHIGDCVYALLGR